MSSLQDDAWLDSDSDDSVLALECPVPAPEYPICCICREECTAPLPRGRLNCSCKTTIMHVFCATEWFVRSGKGTNCPTCREEFRREDRKTTGRTKYIGSLSRWGVRDDIEKLRCTVCSDIMLDVDPKCVDKRCKLDRIGEWQHMRHSRCRIPAKYDKCPACYPPTGGNELRKQLWERIARHCCSVRTESKEEASSGEGDAASGSAAPDTARTRPPKRKME